MDKGIDKEIQTGKPRLEDIFNNLPVQTNTKLNIPSRGKFYRNKNLVIRPIKLEDEKIIATSKLKGLDATEALISRCVPGLEGEDLLLIDVIPILIQLRSISYGPIYEAQTVCGNCESENTLSINVDELPIDYVPDDLEDIREITLPVTKAVLKIRFLRNSDKEHFKDYDSQIKNLWRLVISINGEEDKSKIAKVLQDDRFPIKDLKVILKNLSPKYGLVSEIKYKCQNCQGINLTALPLGEDFLSVS